MALFKQFREGITNIHFSQNLRLLRTFKCKGLAHWIKSTFFFADVCGEYVKWSMKICQRFVKYLVTQNDHLSAYLTQFSPARLGSWTVCVTELDRRGGAGPSVIVKVTDRRTNRQTDRQQKRIIRYSYISRVAPGIKKWPDIRSNPETINIIDHWRTTFILSTWNHERCCSVRILYAVYSVAKL